MLGSTDLPKLRAGAPAVVVAVIYESEAFV